MHKRGNEAVTVLATASYSWMATFRNLAAAVPA